MLMAHRIALDPSNRQATYFARARAWIGSLAGQHGLCWLYDDKLA
jgi:hypothetical protein